MSDRPIRSIAKAISWRATGTIDTMLISFLVTGKLTLAISIGSAELLTKTVLYFVHERVWEHIKFGKAKSPEYNI